MPFAQKYRFAMRFPEPGDTIDGFRVESCEVGHDEKGDGTIFYPFVILLSGKGGRQGVGKAVRAAFAHGHTTFSGFGNPYQLRFGRFTVEALGTGRYSVTGCGYGCRIDLERELSRFVAYARLHGKSADDAVVAEYIEAYKRDVTRKNPEIAY